MSLTHLAQLNVARFLHPTDDPRMAGFMDNLDRINAIAERSDGFVWRLKDDSGNATALRLFEGADLAVNLSVWQSAEALEKFVWNTVHSRIYNGKAAWFEKMATPHFVLWSVPAGHIPTLAEAKARLDHLTAHGDSDHAFGWAHLPHIKLWMAKKCG